LLLLLLLLLLIPLISFMLVCWFSLPAAFKPSMRHRRQ
jgi:hypothetical protein